MTENVSDVIDDRGSDLSDGENSPKRAVLPENHDQVKQFLDKKASMVSITP